jgi:ZIP family zinc transporter
MDEFLLILLFSLLPALGTFAGGIAAEFFEINKRNLSLALHVATGIILAVISIELMPQILKANTPWIVISAFIAGGVFFVAIDQLINFVQGRLGDSHQSTAAWAIFFGVAIDSFTDGILIGAGSLINLQLGLLIAIGLVSADIPEGFATLAAFKERGIKRSLRILLNLLASLPVLLGASAGYLLVKGQPAIVEYSILAFTAGILLTVTAEEIIPESHKNGEARLAALALIGGFALFAFISSYLTI